MLGCARLSATLSAEHAPRSGPFMKVSIAIPTVNREALLKAAVAQTLAQDFARTELEIIVVDNSPGHTQAWICDAFAQTDDTGRRLVRCVHEPVRGLASARNRAIDTAAGRYLVFLDDDEQPADAHWLATLTGIAEATQADAVFGPVLPAYEQAPGRYRSFIDKLYTRRLARADGADISEQYHYVGSGNSCFRTATCFREPQARFDTRFDAFGGEDTEFLRRLVQSGRRLAWASNAPVCEHIPVERTVIGDLVARRFAKGQNRSFMQIATPPARPAWLLFWMAAGAAQAVYHSAAAAGLRLAGRRDAADAHAIEIYGGLGKVLWQKRFRARRYAPPSPEGTT